MSEDIFVGAYIMERLVQLGVTHVFGVPGDFNLGFLDFIEDHPNLEWVGNCNELNAAYSADGYARIKEGLGVVVTTFGVGELSAMNGHAGAFSEHVPILHIAGNPNTTQVKTRPLLHHTLGDGRFDAYIKTAQTYSVAWAELTDVATAPQEIDRVITAILTQARPGYLTLPTDMAYLKVPNDRLKTPLSKLPPPNDPETEKEALDAIVKAVQDADGDAVVLVDVCTIRHYVRDEVTDFFQKTQFPVYTAPMAKTAVSEHYARYGGVYVGTFTHPDVKEKVESAKVIISIGSIKSDFNTGGFSYNIPSARTIELHSTNTRVRSADYQGVGMKGLLPKLTAALEHFKERAVALTVPRFEHPVPPMPTDVITQEWFWPRVAGIFRPHDVIVAETGTSYFGLIDVPLPDGAIFVAQMLWGSIGYAVGGMLGAAIAARDRKLGRTFLFIGDGSIQLTAQEITPMLRLKLNPIIFLLNNKGYTIERWLHGESRRYNDVVNWKYTQLLSTFGGEEGKTCQSYLVRTPTELEDLLNNEAFLRADKAQLVEVAMDVMDAPRLLKIQSEASIAQNKYVP